jgi:hypothetical protein
MADYQVKRVSDGHVVARFSQKDDAEKYMADNFPRRHANPGTDYGDDGPPADVELVSPSESMIRPSRGKAE